MYLEENEVIFETIRQSAAAAASYREYSGREANVLVSEDGLAPLMGGKCGKAEVDRLIESYRQAPQRLTPEEKKAAQRILFYRQQGVGFIARPAKGRAGLFKKASNLNYTMRYGDLAERGLGYAPSGGEMGLLASGYSEGDCRTHEIILLLDKDSGVSTGILEAITPEFALDEKLAYVQCATNAINLRENYYSRATGYQTNELFHYTWPCRALQGYFVPLVGHNVFVRRSILEKCGRWSEDKVSEDFDMAIRFYGMGYHGKYAKIPGLEFTEYTSTSFEEETGKQRRYAYGLYEMMFDGTVQPGITRSCDLFWMVLYFFSIINQVLLLPTVFFECYFGNIHLLWAGFLVCDACFILLPWIRGLVMNKRIPREHRPGLLFTLEVAVSFVSHSLSVLSGTVTWILNKYKKKKEVLPLHEGRGKREGPSGRDQAAPWLYPRNVAVPPRLRPVRGQMPVYHVKTRDRDRIPDRIFLYLFQHGPCAGPVHYAAVRPRQWLRRSGGGRQSPKRPAERQEVDHGSLDTGSSGICSGSCA